jgi:hypothetical protein
MITTAALPLQEFLDLLAEGVVDPGLRQLAEQCTHGAAEGGAEERHEEQQPDQHSPEGARGGAQADDLLGGFDVAFALRVDGHDGHTAQVGDEV